MKMADILRNLADKLDGIEGGGETARPANTGPTADHFRHDVDDGAESGDKDVEVTGVMIPPLQAKLELLKKATGVDNVYDSGDELDDIKKLTGIKAVIAQEAGEDNDITG